MSFSNDSLSKGEGRFEIPRATVSAASEHIAAGETIRTNTVGQVTVADPLMTARDVNVYYGNKHAIKDVSIDVAKNLVIAFIGPSG